MGTRCRAWSKETDRQCPNNAWFGSRYCWHHLDRFTKWSPAFFLAFLALISGWLIHYLQIRTPDVTVRCELSESWTPCELNCVVRNDGRGAALDVAIGFNRILPMGTSLLAPSDTRLRIEESDLLPHPDLDAARYFRAFIVRIPLVPPKSEIDFSLVTTNRDNQRACTQVIRLRNIQHQILEEFYVRVQAKYSQYLPQSNLDLVKIEAAKAQCLFHPGYVMYGEARLPIEFKTDAETKQNVLHSQIYRDHKKEFIEIFQNKGEYKAPVFLVKQSEGSAGFASYPAYIKTYVLFKARLPKDWKPGSSISPPIVPPKSYD